MNRWAAAPSKASANTLCQKCLKRGHYSYECTASQQDRPYVSRPSRSQVLRDPKLAPRISTAQDVSKASDVTNKSKNSQTGPLDAQARRSRTRSASASSSYSSSNSVATISTDQSPPRSRDRQPVRDRHPRQNQVSGRFRQQTEDNSDNEIRTGESRQRRRYSSASESSRSRNRGRTSTARRTTRRAELPRHHREGDYRSRSRSPYSRRHDETKKEVTSRRERSLSPYSKRIARSSRS